MTEQTSCAVCCEDFNKSLRTEIKCNNCDYSVCKTCVRTYLTSTTSDPKCMNCNVAWSRNEMLVNLNRSYLDKEYKVHRSNVLVDAEMGRMPDTVRFAENVKYAKGLETENAKMRREIREKQQEINKMNEQIYRNSRIMAHPERRDATDEGQTERKQFVMACPDEDCRGFLSSAYKCGLCNKFTCPDCLTIIGENKNEEHKCNEDCVKTAEMIKKDTKPCPACGDRIFKIMGCDQMYCTSIRKDGSGVCGTAFSWRTGKIETGTIHNPHFYEMQRRGGQAPIRNPGDVLCGGVPDIRYFGQCLTILLTKSRTTNVYSITGTNQDNMIHHLDLKILEDIYGIHQFASEVNQYELQTLRREVTDLGDNRDARVKYLLKEINKDEMGRIVLKNDVARQKKVELLNVMEILGVTGIEFMNDVVSNVKLNNINNHRRYLQVSEYQRYVKELTQHDWHNIKDTVISSIKERITILKNTIKYCNEQFKIIGITYNCTSLIAGSEFPVPQPSDAPGANMLGANLRTSPYDRWRQRWKFTRQKYCLKDLKS